MEKPALELGNHDFQSCCPASQIHRICRAVGDLGRPGRRPSFPVLCGRFLDVTADGGPRRPFPLGARAPTSRSRPSDWRRLPCHESGGGSAQRPSWFRPEATRADMRIWRSCVCFRFWLEALIWTSAAACPCRSSIATTQARRRLTRARRSFRRRPLMRTPEISPDHLATARAPEPGLRRLRRVDAHCRLRHSLRRPREREGQRPGRRDRPQPHAAGPAAVRGRAAVIAQHDVGSARAAARSIDARLATART
jgi:hypothetical protein